MIEYTSISAHYSGDEKEYTFICEIGLANRLKYGDIVIVNAANGLGVVRVLEVHKQSHATGPYNYRWAFQKVDMECIAELEEAQREKKIEAYISDVDDIPFDKPDEKSQEELEAENIKKAMDAKREQEETKKSANPPKLSVPHVPKL